MENIKIKNVAKHIDYQTKSLFPVEDSTIIIPYQPSGYVDYANTGYVEGQKTIDSYLTYKRLYTGNDAFIITWKDSTFIDRELDKDGNIKIGWKMGEVLLGWNQGLNTTVDIDNDSGFSDYKKMTFTNTISFRMNKGNLTHNHNFMFYKIPEVSGDILYRVVGIEQEYIEGIYECDILTLQSLNQELETTGRAKSQNVMPNAPGQGYFDPKIVKEQPFGIEGVDWMKIDDKRYITRDIQKFANRPVKKVVVKCFGLSMISNFVCYGRKVKEATPMSDFGLTRTIFPIGFERVKTPTLYRTQQAEENFYYIWNVRPYISFTKKFWEEIKNTFQTNRLIPSQGVLEWDTTLTPHFRATNKKSNEGVFQSSLYGTETPTLGNTIWYTMWKVLLGGIPNPKPQYYSFFNTVGTSGVAKEYRIQAGDRYIHDRMFDNYWTQKHIQSLPIAPQNTVSYDLVSGLVAYSLMFWTGLMSIGNKYNKYTKRQGGNAGFGGIIPASVFDFMREESANSVQEISSGNDWINLNHFVNSGGSNDNIKRFINTDTMNVSLQASLTDLFRQDRNIYETVLLGQTKYKDGKPIFGDNRQLLVNGSETLVSIDETDIGFIIDGFNLQGLFSGDFSVEFLDKNDDVVWSGVYESEAKWTGSIREWNTFKNTSIYGRENIFLEKPIPWPEDLPVILDYGSVKEIVWERESNDGVIGKEQKTLWDTIPRKTGNFTIVNKREIDIPNYDKIEIGDFQVLTKPDILEMGTYVLELYDGRAPLTMDEFWKFYNSIVLEYDYCGTKGSVVLLKEGFITTARSIEVEGKPFFSSVEQRYKKSNGVVITNLEPFSGAYYNNKKILPIEQRLIVEEYDLGTVITPGGRTIVKNNKYTNRNWKFYPTRIFNITGQIKQDGDKINLHITITSGGITFKTKEQDIYDWLNGQANINNMKLDKEELKKNIKYNNFNFQDLGDKNLLNMIYVRKDKWDYELTMSGSYMNLLPNTMVISWYRKKNYDNISFDIDRLKVKVIVPPKIQQ